MVCLVHLSKSCEQLLLQLHHVQRTDWSLERAQLRFDSLASVGKSLKVTVSLLFLWAWKAELKVFLSMYVLKQPREFFFYSVPACWFNEPITLSPHFQWKKYWFVLTDHSLRYYKDSIAEEVIFAMMHLHFDVNKLPKLWAFFPAKTCVYTHTMQWNILMWLMYLLLFF